MSGQRRALGLTALGLWVLAAGALAVQVVRWAREGAAFCGTSVTGRPFGAAHFSLLPPAPRCTYAGNVLDRDLQPLYGVEWTVLAVLAVWLVVVLVVLRWYPRHPFGAARRLQTPARSGR